jgi:DnaK suppressor protein
MTEQELGQFKKLLEEQKAEYLETLRTSLESGKGQELDQQRIGRLSRMDALQSQSIVQAANRRMQGELSQIEAALGRIERGAFGTCQLCGREIAFARLELYPSTTECINCARRNG